MKRGLAMLIGLAILLAGCKRDAERSDPVSSPASYCPMLVPGAEVDLDQRPGGAVLAFSTSFQKQVNELRQRVRRMAQLYRQRDPQARMMWHQRGPQRYGPPSGLRPEEATFPPVEVTVQQQASGIRLVLQPAGDTKLTVLRDQLREHWKWLSRHHCWLPRDAWGPRG